MGLIGYGFAVFVFRQAVEVCDGLPPVGRSFVSMVSWIRRGVQEFHVQDAHGGGFRWVRVLFENSREIRQEEIRSDDLPCSLIASPVRAALSREARFRMPGTEQRSKR